MTSTAKSRNRAIGFEMIRPLGPVPRFASDGEVLDLVARYRAGDDDARDELILRLLPYAMSLGARYGRHLPDPDEVASAAARGVIRAVEMFDPDTVHNPDADDPVIAGLYARTKSWVRAKLREAADLEYRRGFRRIDRVNGLAVVTEGDVATTDEGRPQTFGDVLPDHRERSPQDEADEHERRERFGDPTAEMLAALGGLDDSIDREILGRLLDGQPWPVILETLKLSETTFCRLRLRAIDNLAETIRLRRRLRPLERLVGELIDLDKQPSRPAGDLRPRPPSASSTAVTRPPMVGTSAPLGMLVRDRSARLGPTSPEPLPPELVAILAIRRRPRLESDLERLGHLAADAAAEFAGRGVPEEILAETAKVGLIEALLRWEPVGDRHFRRNAVNTIRTKIAALLPEDEPPASVGEDDGSASTIAGLCERPEIAAVIDGLSERDREIFRLSLEGLSNAKVGRQVGVGSSTAGDVTAKVAAAIREAGGRVVFPRPAKGVRNRRLSRPNGPSPEALAVKAYLDRRKDAPPVKRTEPFRSRVGRIARSRHALCGGAS